MNTHRRIGTIRRGNAAIDGLGVHLVRVIARADTGEYHPFLMLNAPFGELDNGTFLRTKTVGL